MQMVHQFDTLFEQSGNVTTTSINIPLIIAISICSGLGILNACLILGLIALGIAVCCLSKKLKKPFVDVDMEGGNDARRPGRGPNYDTFGEAEHFPRPQGKKKEKKKHPKGRGQDGQSGRSKSTKSSNRPKKPSGEDKSAHADILKIPVARPVYFHHPAAPASKGRSHVPKKKVGSCEGDEPEAYEREPEDPLPAPSRNVEDTLHVPREEDVDLSPKIAVSAVMSQERAKKKPYQLTKYDLEKMRKKRKKRPPKPPTKKKKKPRTRTMTRTSGEERDDTAEARERSEEVRKMKERFKRAKAQMELQPLVYGKVAGKSVLRPAVNKSTQPTTATGGEMMTENPIEIMKSKPKRKGKRRRAKKKVDMDMLSEAEAKRKMDPSDMEEEEEEEKETQNKN